MSRSHDFVSSSTKVGKCTNVGCLEAEIQMTQKYENMENIPIGIVSEPQFKCLYLSLNSWIKKMKMSECKMSYFKCFQTWVKKLENV